MSVRFLPPILISFVLQTESLIFFIKKNKSNLKKLCAMHDTTSLFSLTIQLQKSCEYPFISPVMCE